MTNRNKSLLLFGGTLTIAACFALAQDQGIQAVIGNVFLQNITPGTAQVGHATITGTFRAGQVFVQQSSTATIPVVGNNTATTGNTLGGSFSSASPTGIALRGTATASNGSATGVLGDSRNDDGIGVHGKTTGGIGVFGSANSGVGVSGTSSVGNAIVGQSGSAAGVIGLNNAAAVPAVIGANNATTGQAPGGSFSTSAPDGHALLATAKNTTGFSKGLVAESKSTISGQGVLGIAATAGAGFGVHGQCLSANGFGVFCEGKFAATGTKSFLIDHPLDPENRYLVHYCSEGPVPRNAYTGHVTTDAQGYAWVALPDYYESVNTNPEYQLTVIDSSDDFVLAKVTRKVVAGRFQIRTSKPRVEVSWRIDAVRDDRWVRTYGHNAEPIKPEVFRGTYLNPEFYGQPMTKAQSTERTTEQAPKRP